MARLAPLLVAVFAASCGALLLLVLLLAAPSAAARAPAVVSYVVGDDATGWAPPPGAATNTLSWWAMRRRFHVGDVLDFKYSENDSVLLVRRGDYGGCRATSPVRRLAGGGGAGTKFRLDRPGLFYFISGAPARCEAGQRMVVRVVDARGSPGAPTPAPAPAPAPGGTGDEPSGTPPSGDRPIPVPFKLFVAAFIGFISGCFVAGFILWLCRNCRRR